MCGIDGIDWGGGGITNSKHYKTININATQIISVMDSVDSMCVSVCSAALKIEDKIYHLLEKPKTGFSWIFTGVTFTRNINLSLEMKSLLTLTLLLTLIIAVSCLNGEQCNNSLRTHVTCDL